MRIGVISLSLLLIVCLLAGCADGPATAYPEPPPSALPTELPAVNQVSPLATPEAARLSLPVTYHCQCNCPTPMPMPTGPAIFDCNGTLTNTAWLTATFGAVNWTTWPTSTARLAEIVPCCGDCPAVIVAHVESDGVPLEGIAVVFYWPDAPLLPAELRGCGLERGVWGSTNAGGDVGFGLGGGSYYWPPAGGPHTVWVGGLASDCIAGLGMIGNTNHEHPDVGFSLSAHFVTTAPNVGFSPYCLSYTEIITGYEPMEVLRCQP